MSCGAEIEAKRILASLLEGKDFSLPDIDFNDSSWELPESMEAALQAPITSLTIEDLTQSTLDGTGTIDLVLKTIQVHLKEEHSKGRISGAEYTKAYIALITAGIETGLQFALQKDQARLQALTAQMQALTAKVSFETAKAQYMATKASALNAEAQYGLTVMKMATEDAQFCILQEQKEAARAQTMDTRTDGTPIKGSVGKQKELHTQQITSYQRSSETNAVQVLKDAWIAHKSIDEGIDTPAAFNATAISQAITALINNNNLN